MLFRKLHHISRFQTIQLLYISDGNYDAGHYDLVVKSPDVMEEIELTYQYWREQKIKELCMSYEPPDNSSYGL